MLRGHISCVVQCCQFRNQYLLTFYFSHLELRQLREAGEYLLRDEVDPAVLGPQVQLPLEPGVRADSEAGARVPGHHAGLPQRRRGGPGPVLRRRPGERESGLRGVFSVLSIIYLELVGAEHEVLALFSW